MGFWSRLIGREEKAAVPDPANAVQLHTPYSALFQSSGELTAYQCWQLYKSVAPFAKIVDLIADAVSNLHPIVYVDGEPVDGHPVANFLNRPGFNRTRQRFLKEAVVQLEVTGTFYLHAYGNVEYAPVALDVLKSQFVSHAPGHDMWPLTYLYAEGTRTANFTRDQNPRDFRWFDDPGLSEIIPIYDMDGDRRGVGLPRLQAIRNDVELRLKGIVHNSSMIDNGARLSGILTFDGDLNPEQERAVQAMFEHRATGAHNAGRVMVASGGKTDFKPLQQSMRDMDFTKLIEMVEDSIAARYNVPVTLFRTNAQTNNNYETAWNILYDQAVLPTFNCLMTSIGNMFSNRLGQQIDIRHDALTAPILARQSVARAKDLFSSNLVTRNEARSIVGYEPVLGGDVILGPMGLVPQGEDLFTGIDDDAATESERTTRKPKPSKSPETSREEARAEREEREESEKRVTKSFKDLKSAMEYLATMKANDQPSVH